MVWTVPRDHLKKKPIPITRPMLAVLDQMQARRVNPSDDAGLISPPPHAPDGKGKPFDPAKISALTRILNWEKPVTPHGFRHTLQGWRDEHGNCQVSIPARA
jgi:hypothetical protein